VRILSNKVIYFLLLLSSLVFVGCTVWDMDDAWKRAWIDGGYCGVCWRDPCICVCDSCKWIISAPTCASSGEATKTCTRNKIHNETIVVKSLEHDWVYDSSAVPPTCTTAGSGQGICQNCSAKSPGDTYPPLGHDWNGSWSAVEGSIYKTCLRINCSETQIIKNEIVWINSGTFQMDGTDSGGTTRPVTLTSGFYIGKYEVTQAQYKAVMNNANPSYFGGDHLPVESVSWYDVIVFCNRLSIMEGLTPAYQINGSTNPDDWGTAPTSSNETWNAAEIIADATGYRLPTEAQWEYACRAGTTTAFNWGSNIINSTQANYEARYVDTYNTVAGTYIDRTTEVGSYAPNAWGLHDMHGNVHEWCWDWYGSYASGSQTDPRGAASGSDRVTRGGSWSNVGQGLRSAYRGIISPDGRGIALGFRLLRP